MYRGLDRAAGPMRPNPPQSTHVFPLLHSLLLTVTVLSVAVVSMLRAGLLSRAVRADVQEAIRKGRGAVIEDRDQAWA